jgi:hypothetical protein
MDIYGSPSGKTAIYKKTTVPVQKTPYELFEQRNSVKNECSADYLDLHRDFRQQRDREDRLKDKQKQRAKEIAKETEEQQYRMMNANGKVHYLVDQAKQNLERGLNINGGFMRKVNESLDEAYRILEESQGKQATEFYVSPETMEDLYRARAEEQMHNWGYLQDLARYARDMTEREQKYRQYMQQYGLPPLFDRPLVEQLRSDAVYNNMFYESEYGDRGLNMSKYHSDRLYS